MRTLRVFSLMVVLCLEACVTTAPPSKPPEVTPKYDVEVETMEDQANSAVGSTPTKFSIVSAADDKAYWARASLFFKQYTDTYEVKGNTVRSKPGNKNRFIYEVARVSQPSATTYTIKCIPGGGFNTSTDVLSLNAKNLARFIREGNLELSLLQR